MFLWRAGHEVDGKKTHTHPRLRLAPQDSSILIFEARIGRVNLFRPRMECFLMLCPGVGQAFVHIDHGHVPWLHHLKLVLQLCSKSFDNLEHCNIYLVDVSGNLEPVGLVQPLKLLVRVYALKTFGACMPVRVRKAIHTFKSRLVPFEPGTRPRQRGGHNGAGALDRILARHTSDRSILLLDYALELAGLRLGFV
ncbi:hypothetical protein K488DRAFT_86688 [Vararia minispora EC-137]|uniref:Uncharacterized protein n=1 Tax=Vararia minispora EC-137 TaxID=1314806 RepID=A0ACB8QIA6_9AGAM|nr:hypothetical protein K488DRAFT_86688 [Vararia minispora EC-137]